MANFTITCTPKDFPAGTVVGQIQVTLTGVEPPVAPVVILVPDADGVASFPETLAPGSYTVSAQLLDASSQPLGDPVSLSFVQAAPITLLVPTAIIQS